MAIILSLHELLKENKNLEILTLMYTYTFAIIDTIFATELTTCPKITNKLVDTMEKTNYRNLGIKLLLPNILQGQIFQDNYR